MNMFIFKESFRKKIFIVSATVLAFTSNFSFANKKVDKVKKLIEGGSAEEIELAFKQNNFMNRTRFDKNGDTLILEAIENNRDTDIIKLLLKADVGLKTKNYNGQSALHYISLYSSDNPDTFRFILRSWGDKNDVCKGLTLKDKFEKNPYEYALDKNDQNMLSIYAGFLGEETASVLYRNWKNKNIQLENSSDSIVNIAETDETSEGENTISSNSDNSKLNAQSEKTEISDIKNEVVSKESATQIENSSSMEKVDSIKSDISQEIVLDENVPETENKYSETSNSIVESEKSNEISDNKTEISEGSLQKKQEEGIKTTVDIEKKQRELLNAYNALKKSQNDKTYLFDYEPREENYEPMETSVKEIQLATIKNPNTRDFNGRTPLMKAVKDGNDWEIKSLIQSGSDLNLKDNEGWSALMYAIRYQNNLEIVKLLLDNGADIYTVNKYGSSPLQIAACHSGNPEILRLIIKQYKGNQNDIFKAFVFSITSNVSNVSSQLAKLQVFIDRGISINRFYEGKTPLMYACEYSSSTDIIKLLLDNGANPSIRDANGKKAFDFAKLNSKLERDEVYWKLNSK